MSGSETSDGDAPTDPPGPLGRFAESTRTKFLILAESWFRRYHIDESGLSAAGAVQKTWAVFLERLGDGKLHRIDTLSDFEKTFTHMLRHVFLDEWRRQHARKRARGG